MSHNGSTGYEKVSNQVFVSMRTGYADWPAYSLPGLRFSSAIIL